MGLAVPAGNYISSQLDSCSLVILRRMAEIDTMVAGSLRVIPDDEVQQVQIIKYQLKGIRTK